MNRLTRHIILALVLLTALPSAFAATVVKARLDSTVLLMGRMTTLQLAVEEPKNAKGHFELFDTYRQQGYAPVCGDSVELRMPTKIDTVDLGSRRKMIFSVPVQAFDSGAYLLPQFVYVTGNDTARSNQVALKVVPVPVKDDEQIADYAGTADPEDPSFWDWVPDWFLAFWWVIIIVLLAIALTLYTILRYKKKGYLLPRKPEPTPYEEATLALYELKGKKLWEQGMEKEYYTDLTQILRRYIHRRFGINAEEMTSRQTLASLKRNPDTKDKRPLVRKVLEMADFAKFAKMRPLPEDNVASYDNVLRFVEETKPVEKPEEDRNDKNGKKVKKGGKKK